MATLPNKPKAVKVVHARMDKWGLNIPGSTVTLPVFDSFIGINMPIDPDCADCRDRDLFRLKYIGTYRDIGLRKGRYTGLNHGVIRTYDTRYNNSWMCFYRNKARNASIRGKALNDSTALVDMHHKVANSAHYDVAIDALGKIK